MSLRHWNTQQDGIGQRGLITGNHVRNKPHNNIEVGENVISVCSVKILLFICNMNQIAVHVLNDKSES